MIPYFSVLDTRTAYWKSRKKWWVDMYGIRSEQGRDGTKSKSGFWENNNSVSIFDPVLCEQMYTWFCPPKGKVLDPFAGGSVRGVVATALGFDYTGIELSRNQVMANRMQSTEPNWIIGDSRDELPKLKEEFDFIFTCPPYHDLEVYSEDSRDISNMGYDGFILSLSDILSKSASKLKNNRFVGIVVSEIRDTGSTRNYKIGKYKNFVSDVITMCEKNGLHFYNDMILYNSQHQASRTSKTYFDRNRKIASVHQNVLIFVKGNPDLATEDITWDGKTYECTVDGVDYKSFREAAISIDPIELVGSEVKRRCESTKYPKWQLFGKETKPKIRYEVDNVPFESPKQIVNLLGGDITETICRTYLNSNDAKYRHWKRVNPNEYDISYDELDRLQKDSTIQLTLPIISCNDIKFYNMKDAGEYFGVSAERIRQKLKDKNYPSFRYLY